MAVKVTFTLDDATIKDLNLTAQRLSKPKSEIVREAIRDYRLKSDRMSEPERLRKVAIMEGILARPPERSQREADREIAEIRRARRSGGRLHAAE